MNLNGVRAQHASTPKGMTDSPKSSGLGALDELFASLLEGAGVMANSEEVTTAGWESSLSSPDSTDSSLTAEQQGFWFSTLGLMTLNQQLALRGDSLGEASVTDSQTGTSQSSETATLGAKPDLTLLGNDHSQALQTIWLSHQLIAKAQQETAAAVPGSDHCQTCDTNGAGQGSTIVPSQSPALQDRYMADQLVATLALTDKNPTSDTVASGSNTDQMDQNRLQDDLAGNSGLASALQDLEASQAELSADEQLLLSRAHQLNLHSAKLNRATFEAGATLVETRNTIANRDDVSARTIGNDNLTGATIDAANSKANGDSGSRHDEHAERDHGKSRDSHFSLSQSSQSDRESENALATMSSDFQLAQDRIGRGAVGQDISGAQAIHSSLVSGRRGVVGADLSHPKTSGDGAILPGGELTPSAEGLVPENQVAAASNVAELFESRPLLNSVAAQIATVVEGATEWLNIEIHPQELGQIEIRVAQIDDRLVAQIVAQNEQTGAWLDRERQALQDYLAQHGLELDQVDVFQQPADSSQDREAASDWQESYSHGKFSRGEDSPRTAVPIQSLSTPSAPLGNSGVNILA